jgi:RNA polymerase sigma-70 factor (ECF subfamily)
MSGMGQAFVAAIARPASDADPTLEAALQNLYQVGHQTWPELVLPPERFASHLAERLLEPQGNLHEQLQALDTSALYLTCGCLLGLPPALLALESHFVGELDRVLGRFPGGPTLREEIKQRIRTKLLVAADGQAPKIGGYTGRGELSRWLKVVASREALALMRKGNREVPTDDRFLAEAISPNEDQELAYLKAHYRREFKVAFEEALSGLAPRQRALLRYQLVDGLSIDDLGVIYGVHRATAARWLEKVRAELLDGTRERLIRGIKVGPAELDSIMQLIQSQLDVSIQRILETDPESPPDL